MEHRIAAASLGRRGRRSSAAVQAETQRPVAGLLFLWALLAAAILYGGRATSQERPDAGVTAEMLDAMERLPDELGALPEIAAPADNPQTAAKAALGRRLFFEAALSRDRTLSCASCHDPAKGFADGVPLGTGFAGGRLSRHTPTVLNAAYNKLQFWDGRADSLEVQAAGPMLAAGEMNMPSEQEIVHRLQAVDGYRKAFHEVFGGAPSLETVTKAIAAYERTLVTPDGPFDRYARGDKRALRDDQKRGLALFVGKAACSQCHQGPNFSDDKFHHIGLGSAGDLGRFAVTRRDEDRGAFKTPSLRNVALTAPYMHDGSLASLEAVVDFYDRGGDAQPGQSWKIFPLKLRADEKADLVAFLNSLTGRNPDTAPASPADDQP
jgi:cytochrome c peroxidase